MKPPEPLVDAVDLNARRAPAILLVRHEPLEDDQGTDVPERCGEIGGRPKVVGQGLSEKPTRGHDLVDAAQAQQGQLVQAPSNRGPHQQRAGEHGDRHTDPGHHGHVRAPEVGQVPTNQFGEGHGVHATSS